MADYFHFNDKLPELSKDTSYIEHFQLNHAPFRQEPDPEIFFADAGREKLLRRLLADIEEGKPLIRLTGSEGVGKTLLFLLLARRLPPGQIDPVCLDHPVGSFEDLLRPICLALGRKTEDEPVQRQSLLPEFREQLKERREKRVRVVLIIDDAEKLFLATLERLVRLIGDREAENTLQILLIGRPELDKNLDQLAVYCAGVDLNVRYVLEPLTRAETERYVRYRLVKAGAPADKQLKIFTGDAVEALYQGAGGNIRLTGMLAEKGLITADESGMDRVAAESIYPRRQQEIYTRGIFARAVEWFGKYRVWVLLGTVLAMVLLLVVLRPGKQIETPAPLSEERFEPAAEAPPVIEPAGPEVGEKSLPVEATAATGGEEPVRREAAPPRKEPGPAEKAEEEKPQVAAEAGAAEPAVTSVTAQKEMVAIQPETRKRKEAPPAGAIEKKSPPVERNPQEIFRERLRATSNWLAWSYRGGYTIQLMMLVSETAEENLKTLLARDDYYSIKDDIYILRKASSPTLIVFYGLYDSMAEARRVRNNLPQFLLSNQPYALSIKEALEKTVD